MQTFENPSTVQIFTKVYYNKGKKCSSMFHFDFRSTFLSLFKLYIYLLRYREIYLLVLFTKGSLYRIYSINRPGRLLKFWTLRVGAYSRWALIRGGRLFEAGRLLNFHHFQRVKYVYFATEQQKANNKMRRSNKARFL